MQFDKTLSKYNKNHKFKDKINLTNYPLQKKYDFFIIIPAYCEESYIPLTLESISKQNQDLLNTTLMVVVINNSKKEQQKIKNNNKRTFISLVKKQFNFELIIIDCYSSKYALPNKLAGVGLARKIGMDFCINYAQNKSLFCSIDADTIVDKNYLTIINREYIKYKFKGAVVNFRHQKNSDSTIQKAVVEYEKLLKSIAHNLETIGSPYAFVNMGSTIICSMQAYVAIGGMPPKKATEDFYFLQKLAKYCSIHILKTILVYPSSRSEERVYLGTGFRMKNIQKNILFDDLYINPKAYDELNYLYQMMKQKWSYKSKEIMSSLPKNNSKLQCYLEKNNFINIIDKIQNNVTSQYYFMNQFHRWFDSLKIYKFLKSYDK